MFIYMQLKFAILILYFHMDIILRVCRSNEGKNIHTFDFDCGLLTVGENISTGNK